MSSFIGLFEDIKYQDKSQMKPFLKGKDDAESWQPSTKLMKKPCRTLKEMQIIRCEKRTYYSYHRLAQVTHYHLRSCACDWSPFYT